jgi:hypothetical protein
MGKSGLDGRQPAIRVKSGPRLGLSIALTLVALAWGFVNLGVLLWLPGSLIAEGRSVGFTSALIARSALIAVPTVARYTHRVAISNHRLRTLENGRVSFDWKDYADHSRTKTMTLDAVEFIRRFLLHVLPSGLVRIRHFGFLANRVRKQKLIQCRALLAASQPPIPIDPDGSTSVEDPHGCPICRLGRLILIELLSVETAAVQDTS